MTDGGSSAAARDDAAAAATRLLQAGLPFALTGPAASAHAAQCEAVLDALSPGDSLLRVKLLTSRAVALSLFDEQAVASVAAEATEMARCLGEETARGYALIARCMAEPLPEHGEARLAAAREVLDIAARHDEAALVPVGYLVLLVAHLERGDIRSLDVELTGRGDSGGRHAGIDTSEPARWFRCLRAILDGDTALAERLVEEQFAASRDRDGSDAVALYTTQSGVIHWMQGHIDGAEDGFLAARREHPEQLLWSASLAWLWMLQGRRAAAENLFASLQPFDGVPRDRYWLSTVTVLAQASIMLGSREVMQGLHRMLLPHADRLVPVGIGVAFWGTAARTLGLLEERLGMLDDARRHLEDAIAIAGRTGAQAWLAEAQIELAEFALRHHIADIPAHELLAEASATAAARGFMGLQQRAMARPRIRVLGRFEVVSTDGERVEWTSRKARELLKMLVAARGVATSREVFMDALWPGVGPSKLGNRFSVAVNTVRRALDPRRSLPRQHHLVIEDGALRLELSNLDVDLEGFYRLARSDDEQIRRAAIELYYGDAFSDEPYADWAGAVREDARMTMNALTL